MFKSTEHSEVGEGAGRDAAGSAAYLTALRSSLRSSLVVTQTVSLTMFPLSTLVGDQAVRVTPLERPAAHP